MEEEKYKWFLRDEVVDQDLCTFCGACAAVCPNGIVEFAEDGPALKEECWRNGQGACKDVCHRVLTDAARIGPNIFGFKAKPPAPLGQYEKIVSARAVDEKIRERGQDGGAVTALLAYCMDKGLVDGVIATGSIGKPASQIITKKDELLATSGSKYSTVPTLSAVKDAENLKNAAVVGLPCQVYGIRRTQFLPGLTAHGYEVGENGEKIKIPNVAYVIGLFCAENFAYEKLRDFLSKKGVDIEKAEKIAIRLDELVVTTEDGEKGFDLNEVKESVWPGCRICRDAVSKLADISAGYMGSPSSWTTLIARTPKGVELLQMAVEAGYIELGSDVDIQRIEEFAGLKMQRFNRELKKRLEVERKMKYYWAGDYPGIKGEVGGTYYVKIKTGSGLVKHDYLEKIPPLTEKYGDGTVEVTTRQSISIQGVKGEYIDDIMAEIYGTGLATIGMGFVSACPGTAYCSEALVETKELANELTMQFAQKLTPPKMKTGIAGCPNSCVRSKRHDIGLIGQVKPSITDLEKCNGCGRCAEVCKVDAITIQFKKAVRDDEKCISCGWCIRSCPHEAVLEDKRGYTMWIGGNDARRASDGVLLKSFCTKEEIPALITSVAETFTKHRTKPGRERLGNVIKRVGEGEFVKEVLCNR
ncbi:nitrite reductase [Methanosarcinales archaeon]|nr:MAG: nitrite reductase [Methanosarcinales archaeon]